MKRFEHNSRPTMILPPSKSESFRGHNGPNPFSLTSAGRIPYFVQFITM